MSVLYNDGNKVPSAQIVIVVSLTWQHVSASGLKSKHVAKLKI